MEIRNSSTAALTRHISRALALPQKSENRCPYSRWASETLINVARFFTPTAFANYSPGLLQPWVYPQKMVNVEGVGQDLEIQLANCFRVMSLPLTIPGLKQAWDVISVRRWRS
jgi:hypothetical protein